MELLFVLLIVRDLVVLCKLLEPTDKPTTNKVVYISSRPTRDFIPVIEEEEPSVEDIIEELRLKLSKRNRDWEQKYIWDREAKLERFRIKHGIKPVEKVNNMFNGGLFSLNTV